MALKLSLVLLAGCGTSALVPPARFVNAPPVAVVNDRREVAKQPKERVFLPNLFFFDKSVHMPIDRALSLHRHHLAEGVNALDEVPDSTWFTNRDTTALTPEQIKTGPITHDPSEHRPWAIQSTKTGGTTAGFIVKDASDVKYLLKFDYVGDPPELETATHVIVNRFMWAAGYNVAEDQIIYLHPEDLVLGKDAKKKDELGKTLGPLQQSDVDKLVKTFRHEDDGRLRVLVSRWIDGKPIGGFPNSGVRHDDPNDRIVHERRRDLRGMIAIDTWLDAVDVTEGQFVDAYVTEGDRHYVKHYAIDFGKSMGAMATIDHDWWRGHAYRIDFRQIFGELFQFGLDERWWENGEPAHPMRGISSEFDVRSLEPDNWHPDTPGFVAFLEADRFDQFWGTKLFIRLTPAQIRAAVDAGKLTEEASAAALTKTLIERQRILGMFWFAKVNPLDRFEIEDGALCFDDLALTTQLTAQPTSYAITAFDFGGEQRAEPTATVATAGGHTCLAGLPVAQTHQRYTIYKLTTQRSELAGTTYVHVAADAANALRVVGITRK